MYAKLAAAGKVLRSLVDAGERGGEALKKLPRKRFLAGLGIAAGAHAIGSGLNKAKEYQAGFAPGVIENRVE